MVNAASLKMSPNLVGNWSLSRNSSLLIEVQNACPTLAVRDVFQSCPLYFHHPPPLPAMGTGDCFSRTMVAPVTCAYVPWGRLGVLGVSPWGRSMIEGIFRFNERPEP